MTEISDYISRDNVEAAVSFGDAAEAEFEALAKQPFSGGLYPNDNPKFTGLRVWRVTGFRNYLIIYVPVDDGVDIIRVVHGSRDIDSLLG